MIKFITETIEDISDSISGLRYKWLRMLLGIPFMIIMSIAVLVFALILAIYQTIKED